MGERQSQPGLRTLQMLDDNSEQLLRVLNTSVGIFVQVGRCDPEILVA